MDFSKIKVKKSEPNEFADKLYDEYDKADKEGLKLDDGKARWDLLDYNFVGEGVDILTFGANKYGPNSWKKVKDGDERYFAALMRHIVAWRNGEEFDTETKKHHLAHALCNLMFLYGFDHDVEVVHG